jgi:hypothetical protein
MGEIMRGMNSGLLTLTGVASCDSNYVSDMRFINVELKNGFLIA